MGKKDTLTKILAIGGTVLVWFPILAPVLLSLVLILQHRIFRFDYLMPAELFPVALIGGGVLTWAAFRARSRQLLIGCGFAIAVGMLIAALLISSLTGLATGEIGPTSWWAAVVITAVVVYSLALLGIGAGGVQLLRDLFRTPMTL